ncbi:ABC-2 type transport system ATP-binding protein [Micromonospora pattaloongensis]|uniref:ABC-2 type transport system ATP-binding protein n=1 Tax=Micromonospora pattaloongensis TaxID=405436 RepID=A0A1H3STV3_9ACTN|nr:ABC transporter ATP-binding protein [Micromonospora pattaloongensis]SDZ40559.1 ABC-2 type transport system ATP-binding protein [Micromonospora pattaloongensis]
MADLAISTEKLVKTYGRNRGLAGLDLAVDTGEVYGFLGPNGAGKSTTIRLLLDLIRPTSGRVTVLGADPRRGGVALRRRIGYLAGDFVVDGRQTGQELLGYLANLRGGVPRRRIAELADRLDLDLSRKIKGLSKGNRQKIGVVQAFMHSPELLILDEPTSGLDPFLQQQFVAMVRAARAAGQTVFMSSHVMSEVQQTADRVGIIRDGRLLTVERVEELRERAVRRVEIHFAEPVPLAEFSALPGVSDATVDGSTLRCRLDGRADALVKAAARHTVVGLLSEEPDLEELFFSYYSTGEADRVSA